MGIERRLALVIGIDDYPEFGADHQLFGAEADARAMAAWLVPRGFDVDLVLGADAHQRGILDAMDRLRRRARADEPVLFFFSGHGSQMTDREGDEGDGMDETLVPCDSSRSDNRDITDDQIHAWAADMLAQTQDLVLIFDCCHSATLHRPGWRCRSVPADRRPVSALPPSPLPPSSKGQVTKTRDIRIGPEPLILSACGDKERAWELPARHADGQARGAFSFHLLRALDNAQPETTWHEVMGRVRKALGNAGIDQRPEGSGHGYDQGIFQAPGRRRRATAAHRLSAWAEQRDRGSLLEATLFRSTHGPWLPVGRSGFREGDRLRLDLRLHGRRGLYIYVLDLGITGAVDVLFPDRHGHELLDPGTPLAIGARAEDCLELYFPEDFEGDHGLGHLLILACDRRLSTSMLLEQDPASFPHDVLETLLLPCPLRR